MTAETSPMSPTGANEMVVRIPRQAIQWRKNATHTLWAKTMTPFVLNGRLRWSLLHRPISTRSAPGSSPQPTGWWTIIQYNGYRETKPHVFEWGVFGVYQHCFCMLKATKSHTAVLRILAGSHHGWVFGEDLPQPVYKKSRQTRCSR